MGKAGKKRGRGRGGGGGVFYEEREGEDGQYDHGQGMDDETYRLLAELLRARGWAPRVERRSWLQHVYARVQILMREVFSALFPTRSEYEQRRPPPEWKERQGQGGAGGGHSGHERVRKEEPEVSCFAVLGLEPTGEGVTEEAVKRAYRCFLFLSVYE